VSKAVVLRIGQSAFLAETDDSIQTPADLDLVTTDSFRADRAGDFATVVDVSKIETNFVEVKQLIISCCMSLHEAMANIPNPEKVAIEFGVKLIGETGIPMLTKASGEANFKISVEWKTGS